MSPTDLQLAVIAAAEAGLKFRADVRRARRLLRKRALLLKCQRGVYMVVDRISMAVPKETPEGAIEDILAWIDQTGGPRP